MASSRQVTRSKRPSSGSARMSATSTRTGPASTFRAARATIAGDWTSARSRCLREARRVLRDPHDAEEAVQEALVRAWRRRESCQSRDEPLPWLLQITRNESLRLLARRIRDRERDLAELHEPYA